MTGSTPAPMSRVAERVEGHDDVLVKPQLLRQDLLLLLHV